MISSGTELDLASHALRGVRAYLDYQDGINGRAVEALSKILEPVYHDLNGLAGSLLDAGKFATATEIKVRENERKVRIGAKSRGEEFSGSAPILNGNAVRAARRGQTYAERIIKQFGQARSPMAKLRDIHGHPEAKELLVEARETLIGSTIKANISADEFEEYLGIWDEQAEIFSREGIEGTIRGIDRNLKNFISLRGRADRGTQLGPFIPNWKVSTISTLLGISIGMLAVCAWVTCAVWLVGVAALLCTAALVLLICGC